jgi:hypothetical protein
VNKPSAALKMKNKYIHGLIAIYMIMIIKIAFPTCNPGYQRKLSLTVLHP